MAAAREGGQGAGEAPMKTRRLRLVPLTVDTGRAVLAGDLSRASSASVPGRLPADRARAGG